MAFGNFALPLARALKWGATIGMIGGATAWTVSSKTIDADALKSNRQIYSRAQVASHANKDNRIWVSFGNGVYDITDFVDIHPGIIQILM